MTATSSLTEEPTMTSPNSAAKSGGGHKIRLAILGAFVAAVIAMLVFGGAYLGQLEALVLERAVDWGAWVRDNALIYAVLFVAAYTTVSVLGLPVSVVLSLGGGAIASLAFGFWPGALLSTLLVWMSVVAGSWGLFEFVKRFGASSFDALVGPYVEKFREGFDKDQFFYMLTSRFTPVPPAVMSVVPALLGANRFQFVLAAGIGFLPGVFVYALLGATLGNSLKDAANNNGLSFADVLTFSNTWPLLALLALSIIPIIVRRITAKG